MGKSHGLRIRIVRIRVEASEANAFELHDVVSVVVAKSGSATPVRRRPSCACGPRAVGRCPVNHVDVLLTDGVDIVAGVLEGVASASHAP